MPEAFTGLSLVAALLAGAAAGLLASRRRGVEEARRAGSLVSTALLLTLLFTLGAESGGSAEPSTLAYASLYAATAMTASLAAAVLVVRLYARNRGGQEA